MKNQKGITLVALVITIIVMLILVGVSLSLALGEGGIIGKAKEAGDSYKDADSDAQTIMTKTVTTGGVVYSYKIPYEGITNPVISFEDLMQKNKTELDALVADDKIVVTTAAE